MFENLNNDNVMIYALKAYEKPNCIMSEFKEDMKRFNYLKRLFRRYRKVNELYSPFLSPEGGIQAIRKVLHRFGFDMPALYDADPEGDEIIFELDQYGIGEYETNLYILYYLTDEGHYEFYAEIGDDERMDELMSDEELDEEE